MSAIEYLKKAVEYDMNGRKLESLKLYQSGISALLEICKSEFSAYIFRFFVFTILINLYSSFFLFSS